MYYRHLIILIVILLTGCSSQQLGDIVLLEESTTSIDTTKPKIKVKINKKEKEIIYDDVVAYKQISENTTKVFYRDYKLDTKKFKELGQPINNGYKKDLDGGKTKWRFYSRDVHTNDNGIWKKVGVGTTTIDKFISIVPVEMLGATYSTIQVDGYVNAYSNSGDCTTDASWACARDETTGNNAYTSTTITYPGVRGRVASPKYSVWRSMISFDTSGITDSDTVDSASLFMYGSAIYGDDLNEGVVVVPSTMPDNTLDVAAIDELTFTAWTSRVDFDTFSLSDFDECVFNSTGKAGIVKDGDTRMWIITKDHDFDDVDPTQSGGYSQIGFYTSEESGKEPYMEITTSAGAAAVTYDEEYFWK